MDDKNSKSLAYTIGYLMALSGILAAWITAIILFVKFVIWLLF